MKTTKYLKGIPYAVALVCYGFVNQSVLADQQILDDLIVDGSACIGQDCVNGESFGFDTLRLKENNLRLKFDDTSTTASFPQNDWQLTANDSSNGGANKFSIDDISGGRTPFTVEAGAPSHSLYVDDGGRVGLGTNTPVVEAHIVNGDSPTVRLEQDGSSGFTPQTWDMAGNETNFFIRDATNGSKLPFRIRPNAPTSSIDIFPDKIQVGTSAQDVGMGTSSPSASLHVQDTDLNMLLLDNNNTAIANRNLLKMSNDGGVGFELVDRSRKSWELRTDGSGWFIINQQDTTGAEFNIAVDTGNVIIKGSVTAMGMLLGSSRTYKTDIEVVDPASVMQKLEKMQITEWRYKKGDKNDRHLSPMAEDFHALFKLGPDNKHINPNDLASVAIIAAKELQKKSEVADAVAVSLRSETKTLNKHMLEKNVEVKKLQSASSLQDKELEALKIANKMLQERLASLEKLMTNLVAGEGNIGPKGKELALNK